MPDGSVNSGLSPELDFREVDSVVRAGVERSAFPGAVVASGREEALLYLAAFGSLTYAADAAAVSVDTLYDLASLTKVVVTTTIVMMLVDEGELDLESYVCRFVPEFRGGGRERVTVAHLLSHSSGLPAWRPLFRDTHGKEAFVERICALDLEYEPGSRSSYSDLGFILLGAVIERSTCVDLDRFAHERIFAPLGMRDTLYRPDADRSMRTAPTEWDRWRDRLLRGEVHDENAFAMGGVAAHAGLFGTAGDLARFARMMLGRGRLEGRRVMSEAVVARFTQRSDVPGSSFALGWDTPEREGAYSTAGALFAPESFGHVGFTGTSLWIDPTHDLFLVLLTNRLHPSRENDGIREIRPTLADAAVRAILR